MAATKRTSPDQIHDPDYPPTWAVKYLLAVAEERHSDAKAAQSKLRELGFVIKPVAERSRA